MGGVPTVVRLYISSEVAGETIVRMSVVDVKLTRGIRTPLLFDATSSMADELLCANDIPLKFERIRQMIIPANEVFSLNLPNEWIRNDLHLDVAATKVEINFFILVMFYVLKNYVKSVLYN